MGGGSEHGDRTHRLPLLGKRLPAAHEFWLPVAHGPCTGDTTPLVINYP
jgi:hypothetical protein